jgi:hypothetical protein
VKQPPAGGQRIRHEVNEALIPPRPANEIPETARCGLTFNDMLRKTRYPLDQVRLLRHQEPGAARGRSPYELWRDDRRAFDFYQSRHGAQAHQSLAKATHWASFVGTPQGETMFVGMYRAKYVGFSQTEITPPTDAEGKDSIGGIHTYEIDLESSLSEYIGRLFITWDGAHTCAVSIVPNGQSSRFDVSLRSRPFPDT